MKMFSNIFKIKKISYTNKVNFSVLERLISKVDKFKPEYLVK